jgi:hypothetical protein
VLIVCSSAGQGKTILPLCPKGSRLLWLLHFAIEYL